MLHVNRGHADELRKPTRIEVRRAQGLADGLVTRETVSTRTTRHVVRNEDAVADFDGVHAGADLDRVVGELERCEFRLELWASRDDEGDGTRLDDLREIVTVIGLDEMRPELRGDAAREAEVPRVALLEFLANRGHREHRDAGL